MKKVLYTSRMVPREVIMAHGLEPEFALPCSRSGTTFELAGLCPFARAFLGEIQNSNDLAAVIFTTECDQMRRASELALSHSNSPIFILNTPATRSPAALKMYADEIKRLAIFLSNNSGNAPSQDDLMSIMLAGRQPVCDNNHVKSQIPVALLGGHITAEDAKIKEHINELGGSVVIDSTTANIDLFAIHYDRRQLQDPIIELAQAYTQIPDIACRPNAAFYQWLKQEIANSPVKGIIINRYTWCDLWHSEVNRIKNFAQLPLLDLEHGNNSQSSDPRLHTRIAAFMEMLR